MQIKQHCASRDFIIIMVVTCIVIGSGVLIVLRDKLKWLFPFLFTLIWLGFLYLFFALYNYHVMYLAVFPGLIMVFSSFLGNRYHFILSSVISAVLFVLSLYLNFTHTNFRATYTFIFLVMCIAVYGFDRKNIRVSLKTVNKHLKRGMLFSGVVVYIVIFSIVDKIFYILPSASENTSELFTYVENHKENFYLMDKYLSNKHFASPMLKPEFTDNSVTNSWLIGSPFSKRTQSKYHMEKLYSDMIDNTNAFYLSLQGEEHIQMLARYYNDHYSHGKHNIVIRPVNTIGDCVIYRVMTMQ